ncbi:MAG: hypothetical protein FJ284_13635 [Planctomycetes bacterium]|nr:hypothetical protein [Planctomycetota bacterium]
MMRASLNFTLPDDQDAFDAALLGRRAIGALQEIDRRLRAVVKYGDPTPEVERLVDAVRGMIDEDFLDA